jgi:hypothetical protein
VFFCFVAEGTEMNRYQSMELECVLPENLEFGLRRETQ